MAKIFTYEPDGAVLTRFFWDRNPVAIIQGPIECLSGDTEFLSDGGWVRIDRWDGHRVAEWREDGQAELRRPLGYVAKPCDEMWSFSNDHALSMVVSDEHRVPLYDRNGNLRVRRACEIADSPGRYTVPTTFSPNSPGLPMTDAQIRLHVAIAADGCLPKRGNQIVITLRKARKKARLRKLLSDAGLSWREHQHSTRLTELAFAFCREGWSKGFTPEWWQASQKQLEVIIDECVFWDGMAGRETRFYTTVSEAADFIQYAAHACGRRASITRRAPRKEGWSEDFVVHIARKDGPKSRVGLRVDNVRIERVKAPGGKKYCFETSTGYFLARHNGRIFVTGNSGTSTACVFRLWCMALEQAPGTDLVRRSRWAIIRNTYSELQETTMKTWSMWMEEKVGYKYGQLMRTRPPNHHIRIEHPDGRTLVDAEFIFLALDVEEDVKKLMSFELTGVFHNEMQFEDKAIFDEAHSRTGRYPAKIDGGPTWAGTIGDLNAPSEGHWIPYMRGDVALPLEWDEDKRAEYRKPSNWSFYLQPPGLIEIIENSRVVGYKENPEAENTKWRQRSYLEHIHGKPKTWIDARVMNRVGLYRQGKPVFESFRPEMHISAHKIEYLPEFPLICGLDFARNPAAVFCQNVRGQFVVLSEIGAENVSAVTFAPTVKQHLARNYPQAMEEHKSAGVSFFGDPTGNSKGQGTDRTPYQIFGNNGMLVMAAPGNNDLQLRLNTIDSMLNSMTSTGQVKLLLDPGCRMLKTAMNGGYHYKKIQGQGRHHDQPHKDHFADYADALQYAALGAGFGMETVRSGDTRANKPTRTRRRKFSIKHGRAA